MLRNGEELEFKISLQKSGCAIVLEYEQADPVEELN